MSNNSRIKVLEDQHFRLDRAITELEKMREYERSEDMKFKIVDLKKKKLQVKDEIAFLKNQHTLDFGN
jgi:hypothetical protein|tara:strand:+ start:289 stop:492 length:204 start_codon:yes stop_codon:yes gene_type:complete